MLITTYTAFRSGGGADHTNREPTVYHVFYHRAIAGDFLLVFFGDFAKNVLFALDFVGNVDIVDYSDSVVWVEEEVSHGSGMEESWFGEWFFGRG